MCCLDTWYLNTCHIFPLEMLTFILSYFQAVLCIYQPLEMSLELITLYSLFFILSPPLSHYLQIKSVCVSLLSPPEILFCEVWQEDQSRV